MEKNFDQWNEIKKAIHAKPDNFGVHEREIWWISFGVNIGVEIDGKHTGLRFIRFLQTNENPLLGGFSRRPKP